MAAVMVRLGPLFGQLQGGWTPSTGCCASSSPGMRVIRGFVREDAERAASRAANADLTDAAMRTGRLFAVVFPFVTLVVNVASAAVVWFGAARVESGELQVGALIAFLSYLVQILTGVMMTTFLAVVGPRAAVSAGRIGEVLGTPSSVRDAAPALPTGAPGRARGAAGVPRRGVQLPRRRPGRPRRASPSRCGPGGRRRSSAPPGRARRRW